MYPTIRPARFPSRTPCPLSSHSPALTSTHHALRCCPHNRPSWRAPDDDCCQTACRGHLFLAVGHHQHHGKVDCQPRTHCQWGARCVGLWTSQECQPVSSTRALDRSGVLHMLTTCARQPLPRKRFRVFGRPQRIPGQCLCSPSGSNATNARGQGAGWSLKATRRLVQWCELPYHCCALCTTSNLASH